MASRSAVFTQLGFTQRRRQVCRMRVAGHRQIDIARRLKISQQRVSQHLISAIVRYPQLAPLLRKRPRRRVYQIAA